MNQKTSADARDESDKEVEDAHVQRTGRNDPVSHPAHYTSGSIEVIDAIIGLGWGRDFCRGNILKYVARYTRKNGVEDLYKAKWYLNRLIEFEGKQSNVDADI